MMPAMRRLWFVAALLVGVAGCSRPSTEDCRKAVLNLQKVHGLDSNAQAPDPEPAVRKCRATGSPAMVACLIAAKTAAEADACQKK